jgi:hypothetical protein
MLTVSTVHLYLLRGVYLLIGVAEGVQIWPGIVQHPKLALMHGVARALLGALTLLSLLGVRYPIKMLPLLFFEITWKLIWLSAFALPLWLEHDVDPDTMQTIIACSLVVIVIAVIPWHYVWEAYVKQSGDPWRRRLNRSAM